MILQRKAWLSLTDQPLRGPDWILLNTCRFTSVTKTTSSCLQRQRHSKYCTLPSIRWGFGGLQSSLRADCYFWHFDISEDTFNSSGSIYGLFAEAPTGSGMHVPQAWIWRTKQTIGFGTNPWLCHQSIAQPRAMHLLTLLALPFREVKIMILCLPILF